MTQAARPASDVSNVNWAPSPLFPHIGNPGPDDASPVAAPAMPGGLFVVGLSPLAPPQAGTLTLTVRLRQTGPCPALATFALLQGGQVIAARSVQATGTFTDYDLALTQDEVDLISDYTSLRLRVLVGGGGSGSGSVCSGSWGCPPGSRSGSRSGSGSGGGVVTSCCPGVLLPTTLYAHFSGGTGACACMNGGSLPLQEFLSSPFWSSAGQVFCSGGLIQELNLLCNAGGWGIVFGTGTDVLPTSASCSPFQLVFNNVPCPGSGTIDITVLTS